jgi:hypothetical protein
MPASKLRSTCGQRTRALGYLRNSTGAWNPGYSSPMLHPLEIPTLEPNTACHECNRFFAELGEVMRSRDAESEQALNADELTLVERRFSAAYGSIFRDWMDHKLTHESGSLRRYLAILNA